MCELNQTSQQPSYDPQLKHRGVQRYGQCHTASLENLRFILFTSWFIPFLPYVSSSLVLPAPTSPHTGSLRDRLLGSGFSVSGPKMAMGHQSWLEPWRTLTLWKEATVSKT